MRYTVKINEDDLTNLKEIRNYFAENDKTMFKHMAFAVIDKILKNCLDRNETGIKL